MSGSAGRVGTLSASRAQPDGYTMLLVNDTFAATEALPVAGTPALYPAFHPVTLAISGPQGLFTHPRSGLTTAQAFAAAAKANPGKLNVGVPGLGSSQHLTSELPLPGAGDPRLTHVPPRGRCPRLHAVDCGHLLGDLRAGAATEPRKWLAVKTI